MKRILILLVLLSTVVFSQDESGKSVEIAVLKTKVEYIEKQGNENREELKEVYNKVNKLEGLESDIDKIQMTNTKQVEDLKWYMNHLMEIIMFLLGGFALFNWYKNSSMKKEREEFRKEKEEWKKEWREEHLKLDEKIQDVEFNSKVGFAINKNTNEEKVEELKKILEIETKLERLGKIYYNIAYYLNASEKRKEALKYIEESIKLDYKRKEAITLKMIILYSVKNKEEVTKYYMEMSKENFEDSNYHNIEAMLLEKLGREKESLISYRKSLGYLESENKGKSKASYYYNKKSYILVKLKKFKEALKAYEKLLELEPNDELVIKMIRELEKKIGK